MIWEDFRTEDGVYGQRRDTLNNKLWNSNDVPLYTGMYSDLYAITDCSGGAIGLGWHQFDFSIRSFKVSKNGVLGEVITSLIDKIELIFPEQIILHQNFPNPFNSSTTIQFHLPKDGKINVDLYTHVIDNKESDDIFKAFFYAGVPEIEAPTDLAIAETMYRAAAKYKVKYILEGHSFIAEGITPLGKNYFDGKYIKTIHKRYGKLPMKTYPLMTFWQFIKWTTLFRT